MLASVQMRRLAEDDLVQLLCSYLSVVDSSLNRYGTKVVRGDVASAPLNEPTGVWAAEARRRTALQMGRGSLAVKPQEVILGQTKSADRWLACEANMRPVPVVTMEPSGQRGISLL